MEKLLTSKSSSDHPILATSPAIWRENKLQMIFSIHFSPPSPWLWLRPWLWPWPWRWPWPQGCFPNGSCLCHYVCLCCCLCLCLFVFTSSCFCASFIWSVSTSVFFVLFPFFPFLFFTRFFFPASILARCMLVRFYNPLASGSFWNFWVCWETWQGAGRQLGAGGTQSVSSHNSGVLETSLTGTGGESCKKKGVGEILVHQRWPRWTKIQNQVWDENQVERDLKSDAGWNVWKCGRVKRWKCQ